MLPGADEAIASIRAFGYCGGNGGSEGGGANVPFGIIGGYGGMAGGGVVIFADAIRT